MQWFYDNWMELAALLITLVGVLIALANFWISQRQGCKKPDQVVVNTSKGYKQSKDGINSKVASVNDKFCHLMKILGNRLLIALLIGSGLITCRQGVPYAEDHDKPEVMGFVVLAIIVIALICMYLFIWDKHNKDKFRKEVRPVEEADTAFDEGYDAYFADMREAANPYRQGTTRREEWLDGWQEGLNDDPESS